MQLVKCRINRAGFLGVLCDGFAAFALKIYKRKDHKEKNAKKVQRRLTSNSLFYLLHY